MATTQGITYSAQASLSVQGITPNPLTAPSQQLILNAPWCVTKQPASDYLAENYTINAGTTATALNLGLINAGALLKLTTTGTIMLSIVQTAGTVVLQVDDFIMLSSAFTGLSVANPGGTAVQISVQVIGNRPAIGSGTGVF